MQSGASLRGDRRAWFSDHYRATARLLIQNHRPPDDAFAEWFKSEGRKDRNEPTFHEGINQFDINDARPPNPAEVDRLAVIT